MSDGPDSLGGYRDFRRLAEERMLAFGSGVFPLLVKLTQHGRTQEEGLVLKLVFKVAIGH